MIVRKVAVQLSTGKLINRVAYLFIIIFSKELQWFYTFNSQQLHTVQTFRDWCSYLLLTLLMDFGITPNYHTLNLKGVKITLLISFMLVILIYAHYNKLQSQVTLEVSCWKKVEKWKWLIFEFFETTSSLYSKNDVLNPQDFAANDAESDSIGASSEEMVEETGDSKS